MIVYGNKIHIRPSTIPFSSGFSFNSTTDVLSEGFQYIEDYGKTIIDWAMSILSQAGFYLHHGIAAIHSFAYSFYYSHIDSYYQENPVLVGSLLILLALLLAIVFCFAIYFFCKLFLLITERNNTALWSSSSSSSASLLSSRSSPGGNGHSSKQLHSPSTIKQGQHSPNHTKHRNHAIAPSGQSSIPPSLHPYISFSPQPFSALRSICRTPSTQSHFNLFLERYLKRRYLN